MNEGSGFAGRPRDARAGSAKGFFDRYKPEQGARLRNGTAIGAGFLAAWGAKFLYERLLGYRTPSHGGPPEAWRLLIVYGIPVLVAVGLALFIYWVVYRRRTSSDFLIATEGEMKKVSWSSRREVVGATKVVIAFTLMMALLLGAVDFLFMMFFQWVGVLKVAGG